MAVAARMQVDAVSGNLGVEFTRVIQGRHATVNNYNFNPLNFLSFESRSRNYLSRGTPAHIFIGLWNRYFRELFWANTGDFGAGNAI